VVRATDFTCRVESPGEVLEILGKQRIRRSDVARPLWRCRRNRDRFEGPPQLTRPDARTHMASCPPRAP
jgi:hypothetical protein